MRVLYFHQHFTTPRGAGGIRSYQLARALVERGHSVTMVCGALSNADTGLSSAFRGGVRRGSVDGIDVIEFALPYANSHGFVRRSITFARFAVRSVAVAAMEPCDVAFATSTPLTAAIPGMFVRWLRRKPFVFEVRDLWPDLPREMGAITNPAVLKLLALLEWASYRSATKLVALAPGIESGIQMIVKEPSKVAMIPNGCDIDLFARDVPPWRPDGVEPSDLMAVFAGAHGKANGLDAVLDTAAVLLRRRRSDIKLVLIGAGGLKDELVARAAREGLSNLVFLAPVAKVQIVGLMKTADVGLQVLANVPVFYYGTSPNKFFDYIAAGVPVAVNYPGWLADLVREHKCGFAVEPDSPEEFADALEHAADNRRNLAVLAVNAKRLAALHFDRDVLAQQFVAWLESSVADGSERA